jgi:hypothetical protein
MGMMPTRQMPVNLTFAGKAYEDEKLMQFAYAYEKHSRRRTQPPLTPSLPSDDIPCIFNPVKYKDILDESHRSLHFTHEIRISSSSASADIEIDIKFSRNRAMWKDRDVEVWLNGSKKFAGSTEGIPAARSGLKMKVNVEHEWNRHEVLGWDLKPMEVKVLMILVVARAEYAPTFARLWVHQEPPVA